MKTIFKKPKLSRKNTAICAYVIDEDGNATFIQAENDYAVATTIGEQSFTKVTLALVVANTAEQPDATTPPSNDEEN